MKSRIYIGLVIVAGFVAGLIWYIQDGESTPSVAISGNSGSSNTASDETDKATSALGGTSSSQAISNKTPPTEETKTATSNDVSVVSSSLNARGDVAPTDAPNSHNAAQVKGLNFPPVATVATEFATSRIPAISQLTHVPVENIKLETPIPIYDIYVTLMQGGGLNDVAFNNLYLYIADGPDRVIQAIGVFERGRTNNGQPDMFLPTPWYSQVSAGLQYLARLPQVQAGTYEPRLVLVSGTAQAIWLKSLSDGNDLFYVYHNTATKPVIQAGTLLPAADFMGIVTSSLPTPRQGVSRGRSGG